MDTHYDGVHGNLAFTGGSVSDSMASGSAIVAIPRQLAEETLSSNYQPPYQSGFGNIRQDPLSGKLSGAPRGSADMPWVCRLSDCDHKKGFTKKSFILAHEDKSIAHQEQLKNLKVFRCQWYDCTESFDTQRLRAEHEYDKHESQGKGPKDYHCGLCGEHFTEHKTISRHLAQRHGLTGVKIQKGVPAPSEGKQLGI